MKKLLLDEYLKGLLESKPDWNVTINVHGREVIRCAIAKLNFDMIAGNLLYAPVGLVTYDYPTKRYTYYVD